MIGLHSIQPHSGSKKKSVRIGRGSGSGIGTYSGRGIKGQRARTGGRGGLSARAMKQYLLRIPKIRGFASSAQSFVAVNIGILQRAFNDGEVVTPKILRAKGIIARASDRVKILGGGKLAKKLKVSAHAFSQDATDAIVKAGGSVHSLMQAEPAAEPKKARTEPKS